MRRPLVLATWLFLIAFLPSFGAGQEPAPAHPNILLILCDDLGYGDVRCLNPEGKIPTPNVDKLAASGMVFTDAHSSSAVCSPTRYGILTGRYNWRSRLKNGVLGGMSPPLIEPGRLTLAGLLKRHGYHTACIGKWHLGMDWTLQADAQGFNDTIEKGADGWRVDFSKPIRNGPTRVGFDYYFGISASLDMVPYTYIENDRVTSTPSVDKDFPMMLGRKTGRTRKGPAAGEFEAEDVLPNLTSKAVDYIHQRAAAAKTGKPFFLYLPLNAPHTPIVPTKEWQGKSGLNPYADFVMQTDWSIGQVLQALERNDLTGNTLVIFTSDNGCSPEAKFSELLPKGHNPNYAFRGHKADIYEGGHHIPFIVRWPGKVKPSTTSSQLICLNDLMATYAEILKVRLPENAGEDSVSILPALLEQTDKPRREALIHHSINGSFSIRQGKWKLALCPGSGGWSAPRPGQAETSHLPLTQLYDLSADLGEKRNVQDQHPEVVERLTKLLLQYAANGRSTPGPSQKNTGEVDVWKAGLQAQRATASTNENKREPASSNRHPNILWLTSEDHGPQMGCYGDSLATTPNIDRLALKGMIYTRAWSCAPVCAPARTTIISGMYPTSTGSEHMRSMLPFPQGAKMFPQILREAGYYCSNNAKEDYNLEKNKQVWDQSSRNGHWRSRKAGQPFFAVFNSEKSHESKVRVRPHRKVHDPAKVRVPAYHPDTPEVREDWAQYYDAVTEADADAGRRLQELEEGGLAADTIVFYYGDHGAGMPRSKRWPYNSGLHVPLVVYIPEKFKHLAPPEYKPGGKSDRLISFVDLAPTLLSLAGIKPLDWMQGHGFMGQFCEPPQPYVYGFRGRMDERYDLVRSVTDGRFVYIRNYMPHKIYGQHINYMFQTPTTRLWKALHDEGKLSSRQDLFWNTKQPEELYDLRTDPDEVNNLAGSPEHQEILQALRQAQRNLAIRIRDVGFLPEGELLSRSEGASPYNMGRDDGKYPFQRIFEAAELASMLNPDAISSLKTLLKDDDSAVRYWAALGLLMRRQSGVQPAHEALTATLKDSSPYVRIAAAEALGRYGSEADLKTSIEVLLELGPMDKNGVFVSLAALNALDALGSKAAGVKDAIKSFPRNAKVPDARYSSYVPRLLEDLVTGLK